MNQEELVPATIRDLQRRIKGLEKRVDRLTRAETARIDRLLAAFLTLPALRGFWPFTSMGDAGAGIDISGQGRALTNNNNVDFAHADNIGHAAFTAASSHYFSRADEAGLSILGNEAYVAAAIQGLTIGGWFYCNAAGTNQGLISKFTTPNQWSYRLRRDTSNRARFGVSTSGSAENGVIGGDSPLLTAGDWFFVWGKWIPGSDLIVAVNNVATENGSGPNAPLFDGTAAFEIGRMDGGSYLDGRAALCFACAAAVPGSQLEMVYEASRGFFGA